MANDNYYFDSEEQKSAYNALLEKMGESDKYHRTMAYLLSCNEVLRQNADTFFDFENDMIRPDSLSSACLTGTSTKTLRLAFNLWNGYTDREEPVLFTPFELLGADDDTEYRLSAICCYAD